MEELSRRSFVVQATAIGAAAAAGVTAAPLLEGAVSAWPAARLPETLVVHVRDLETAELSVLAGTEEIVYRDPKVVAALLAGLARHGS